MDGEAALALDLDLLGDVWLQLEVHVVPDQPGIAVDHGEARVGGAAGDHPPAAAMLAEGLERIEPRDIGTLGQAILHRRQLIVADGIEEDRRLAIGLRRGREGGEDEKRRNDEAHHATSFRSGTVLART